MSCLGGDGAVSGIIAKSVRIVSEGVSEHKANSKHARSTDYLTQLAMIATDQIKW